MKWYNDGFSNIVFSWNRPTYLAVDAYFYKINTNSVFVPKSGDGTRILREQEFLPAFGISM